MNDATKAKNERTFSTFWLTWGVFLFYFSLGMSLSKRNTPTSNIYFGADNWRVYNDLTDIFADHYRINVHPLF